MFQPSASRYGALEWQPDTVIGNQTSTYVLTLGHNPFFIHSGTTISTTSGDPGSTAAAALLGG